MITYQEYKQDSNNLHDAYYEQFVTEEIIRLVRRRFSTNTLKKAGDSFNGIDIRRWDALAVAIDTKDMRDRVKAVGGWWSLADRVCILKAAAKRVVEEQ